MDPVVGPFPSFGPVDFEQNDAAHWAERERAFRYEHMLRGHRLDGFPTAEGALSPYSSTIKHCQPGLDYDMIDAGSAQRNVYPIDCPAPEVSWAVPPYSYPVSVSSESGPASTYSSSRFSGSQSPPWRSPQMMASMVYSPPTGREDFPYCSGGMTCFDDASYDNTSPCIALREIQARDDSVTEVIPFNDDDHLYHAQMAIAHHEAHEGYHPLEAASSPYDGVPSPAMTSAEQSPISVEPDSEPPNLRHRRPTATHSRNGSAARPTRVTKRSASNSSASTITPAVRARLSIDLTDPARSFVCPFAIYGCKSSFGSKNEWKRHVNTQHMRLGFWRCDQCDSRDRKPNDFNRKDLFTQHVRRMHPIPTTTPVKPGKGNKNGNNNSRNELEEQALATIANRCYRHLRDSPSCTSCLYCDKEFVGAKTWDERMEHIGRHMEAMKRGDEESVDPSSWRDDEHMQDWLLNEKLIVASKKGLILAEMRA